MLQGLAPEQLYIVEVEIMIVFIFFQGIQTCTEVSENQIEFFIYCELECFSTLRNH